MKLAIILLPFGLIMIYVTDVTKNGEQYSTMKHFSLLRQKTFKLEKFLDSIKQSAHFIKNCSMVLNISDQN